MKTYQEITKILENLPHKLEARDPDPKDARRDIVFPIIATGLSEKWGELLINNGWHKAFELMDEEEKLDLKKSEKRKLSLKPVHQLAYPILRDKSNKDILPLIMSNPYGAIAFRIALKHRRNEISLSELILAIAKFFDMFLSKESYKHSQSQLYRRAIFLCALDAVLSKGMSLLDAISFIFENKLEFTEINRALALYYLDIDDIKGRNISETQILMLSLGYSSERVLSLYLPLDINSLDYILDITSLDYIFTQLKEHMSVPNAIEHLFKFTTPEAINGLTFFMSKNFSKESLEKAIEMTSNFKYASQAYALWYGASLEEAMNFIMPNHKFTSFQESRKVKKLYDENYGIRDHLVSYTDDLLTMEHTKKYEDFKKLIRVMAKTNLELFEWMKELSKNTLSDNILSTISCCILSFLYEEFSKQEVSRDCEDEIVVHCDRLSFVQRSEEKDSFERARLY